LPTTKEGAMTAEEFAKKNPNKIIYGTTSYDGYLLTKFPKWKPGSALGAVCGYGTTFIYFDPSPEWLAAGCELHKPSNTVVGGATTKAGRIKVENIAPFSNEQAIKAPPAKKIKQRVIPEFPHTCPLCKSPAWISSFLIDCSNVKCTHKYKSKSAQELFLPKEMRPFGTDAPGKHRPEVDDEGFLICSKCTKRAISGVLDKNALTKVVSLKTSCENKHAWTVKVEKGDKLIGAKGYNLVFSGVGFTKMS
jgi:hypothetical protein